MNLILGIDPGKSGAVVFLKRGGEHFATHRADRETIYDIAAALWAHKKDIHCAYIELVGVRPEQGIASSGKFMIGFGEYKGLLAGVGIPVKYVLPQVWMRSMKCMTRGDKNVSKRKAQELFPSLSLTHQTADAMLIAEYGRRQEILFSADPANDI